MRTSTPDGVEIHYTVEGDGPPVVLVHGITDSSADWSPVDERLAADHTVVALDLRGHGQSGDAGDYGALAMATDVSAVVEASGIDVPVVIGHSLGAAVAAAYAAGAPVRGVVAIDQSLRLSDFGAMLGQLEHQLKGSGFHPAMRAIFNSLDGVLVPDELRARLAANRDSARQDVVLGVWELVFGSSGDELDAIAASIGGAITAPVLSIHGNDPGDDYAEWLTTRMPQATVEVELWDEHGHYPHLVDPDRFVERLSGWMEAVTA
jgi:pimeloyl-ACP methyl ester carboxylesterase